MSVVLPAPIRWIGNPWRALSGWLSRALEAFFTTRPAGQGTGLGLAVAHDLIVDAGGWIEVDSMPGEGTTVRIELPLEASSASSLDADLSRVP